MTTARSLAMTVFLSVMFSLISLTLVAALSTTLETEYSPEETMVARIEGALVSPLASTQIELRRGHVLVPFEHGAAQLSTTHYIWGIAPRTPGNYTLVLKDVQASLDGIQQLTTYQQNFLIIGEIAPYAVKPGAINTEGDVAFTITSFRENEQAIKVSHPSPRDIVLVSGGNSYVVPASSLQQNTITLVEIGSYRLPIFVRGNSPLPLQGTSHVWTINPSRLQASLRLNEPLPSFTIVATYRGSTDLKNIALQYNNSLFTVSPPSFKNIKANESITFNVSVKQRLNSSLNEEIRFGSGNETFILPILIESLPQANASRSSNISTNETLPYCSQLSGIVCRSDDVCSSTPVASRDGMCCLALCNPQKQKSKAWIGYLLFGILILIIAIAWHRYKKPAQSEPLALALHKKPHP
jgi:hypothetical protein